MRHLEQFFRGDKSRRRIKGVRHASSRSEEHRLLVYLGGYFAAPHAPLTCCAVAGSGGSSPSIR
jgi:hypothetical protein